MARHPKSLSNFSALLLIAGAVGFLILGSVVMVGFPAKRNPAAEVAIGVTEKPVSAKEQGAVGTILLEEDSAVFAIDVASGTRKKVYELAGDLKLVTLDGPNARGVAVLVVHDGSTLTRFRGVALNLAAGTSKIIFEHRKGVLNDVDVSQISLAQNMNVVYYFLGSRAEQFYDPPSYRRVGEIRRVDLESGEIRVYAKEAIESEIAASPDGKTLWYCGLAEREAAKSLPGVVVYPEGRGKVPVIYSLRNGWLAVPRVASDNIRLLGSGPEWVVSMYKAPGVILDELEASSNRVARVEPVNWPEYLGNVKAKLSMGGYIGSAKQATLADVKYDDRPKKSGKPMDRIVVVDPKKRTISTVVKHVVPFSNWSYGAYVMP